MFFKNNNKVLELTKIANDKCGKVYADVPLNFFDSVDDLKKYVKDLKELGVNVLLILPHFLPSFSAYVVSNYEQPCNLFGNWDTFKDFMKYVADLGIDRMIDIPFNHADWSAANLKRSWYKNPDNNGIEAGADDEDADGNRVRINWGAFILDNGLKELQDYWLEKVIYPHIDNMYVNAIRIDAAWGLDPEGLKRIVGETKKKYGNKVWFLTENLGMDKLINLAKSGLTAGADRFFNNMFWYSGGIYIPTDIYTLYKRSHGVPTCTIYSSHDTLLPAMKAYAKLRKNDIKGMNDKAVVRKFVEWEKISTVQQMSIPEQNKIITLMKLDFALAALMSSDVMFAAGSEKALFKRIDVCQSNSKDFAAGIDSDLPKFMKDVLKIKSSDECFNCEGVVIPFGEWKDRGLKGYVKTIDDKINIMVAINNSDDTVKCKMPKRMIKKQKGIIYSPEGKQEFDIPKEITIKPGELAIIKA